VPLLSLANKAIIVGLMCAMNQREERVCERVFDESFEIWTLAVKKDVKSVKVIDYLTL
jgi:hypothetical protein